MYSNGNGMNAMLDRPLKVTKRTVSLGEWINDMPKGKRRETYESEYGYWIFAKARNERKKHGATNERAFLDALQLTLRRRKLFPLDGNHIAFTKRDFNPFGYFNRFFSNPRHYSLLQITITRCCIILRRPDRVFSPACRSSRPWKWRES